MVAPESAPGPSRRLIGYDGTSGEHLPFWLGNAQVRCAPTACRRRIEERPFFGGIHLRANAI
jgi:hypothetical protein